MWATSATSGISATSTPVNQNAVGGNNNQWQNSILKSSGNFVRANGTVRFDAVNLLQTCHSSDKDYCHMIVDEPKTLYHYVGENIQQDPLNSTLLAGKLCTFPNTPVDLAAQSCDIEFEDAVVAEGHSFNKNFETVNLACKLMEVDNTDNEDNDHANLVEMKDESLHYVKMEVNDDETSISETAMDVE